MNKLVLASSALLVSLNLAGCHTANDVSQYTSQTVGTGVKYGAHAVGTGVKMVADTGAAVGHGVGTVIDTGVNVVTSPLSHHVTPVVHQHKAVVYHNGHRYVWKKGGYVLAR